MNVMATLIVMYRRHDITGADLETTGAYEGIGMG